MALGVVVVARPLYHQIGHPGHDPPNLGDPQRPVRVQHQVVPDIVIFCDSCTLCGRLPALFPTDNPRTLNLIRAVVIASSVLLMLPGAWGNSVTVVEFAHLPAGLAAWQRHSLGVYRVCGPLSKFLYALPAYLAGVRVDAPASFDADIEGRRE
jgi:hypothetical protein